MWMFEANTSTYKDRNQGEAHREYVASRSERIDNGTNVTCASKTKERSGARISRTTGVSVERAMEIAEVKLLQFGSTEDTGLWCKTISMLGREIIQDCTDGRAWGKVSTEKAITNPGIRQRDV